MPQSWQRTNRYYVGSEDLDSHGRWTNVPDYGDGGLRGRERLGCLIEYVAGLEPYWGWTWFL